MSSGRNTPPAADNTSCPSTVIASADAKEEVIEFSTEDYIKQKAPYLALTCFAVLNDAAQFRLGLKDMTGASLFGIPLNFHTINTITAIFLIQDLAVNAPWSIQGMEAIVDIIKKHDYAKEWSHKQIALFVFFILTGAYTAFSDFCMNYLFLNEQDYPRAASVILSAMAVFVLFFSEYWTAYNVIHDYIIPKETKEEKEPAHWLAKGVGGTLGIMSSLEEMLEAYAVVMLTLELEDESAKKAWTILGLGLCNALFDYCYNGKMGIDAIDAFIKKIKEGLPNTPELIGFALSLYSAVLVASAQYKLMMSTLQRPEAALPFELPEAIAIPVVTTLSAGFVVRTGIINTHYTYKALSALGHLLQKGIDKLNDLYRGGYRAVPQHNPDEEAPAPAAAAPAPAASDQPTFTARFARLFKSSSPSINSDEPAPRTCFSRLFGK